jgi:hypothetical protein
MKSIKSIFLVLLSLLVACSKNPKIDKISVTDVVFENSITADYEEIKTDFLLSYPKAMLLSDSNLIILDNKGYDSFFHVLNRTSGKWKTDLGRRGIGPQDLLYTTENPVINKSKNAIQVFDSNGKRFCTYSITGDTADCTNLAPVFAKNNLFVRDFLDMDNYYLASIGLLKNERFAVFEKSLKMIHQLEKYPVLDENVKKDEKLRNELYETYFLKSSPDKQHLLFASYKIGLMEIFDLAQMPEKIKKVKSLLLTKPMKNEQENIYGFEDVYVTDRYIYVLHNGQTAEENPYLSKCIKVFDWEGNPIIACHTTIDLRSLAVDETQKTIYAVAYDKEEGFILIQIKMAYEDNKGVGNRQPCSKPEQPQ